MPPKRPRIVPSQTNLSVQDVRDYTTTDGAAMANEEMRRLKIALQDVQEKQAQAVTDQQAAIGSAPSSEAPEPTTTTTSTYTWTLKAENYREAVIQDKQVVTFRGIDGIRISQVGRTITIGQPRVSWILRGDSGTHTVHYEGIVRVRGVNGVTTRVFPGNPLGTMEIDRPLTVYQRSIAIGDAGTIGLDFFNHSNVISKQEHNQIHFQVQDYGSGVRRITGWAPKPVVQTGSLEGALSTVWIKDGVVDPAISVGYNILTSQYIPGLVLGPWAFQSADNVTTPYAGSGYSNNAIDTQWERGTSIRTVATSAYSQCGRVNESGLYHISGTTQGLRYLTSAIYTNATANYISVRLHYHLIVRRPYLDGYTQQVYKTLDIDAWDLWGINDVNDPEIRQLFVAEMSSLPWSLQGTAQIWLDAGDEVIHMISYSLGPGESRILFQVTYHAFEAIRVADATTLDPDTQVDFQPVNYLENPPQYHDMQFINV